MTKYIVKDWAGNEMNWGSYNTEWAAEAALERHVFEEMTIEGIPIDSEADFQEIKDGYMIIIKE